MQCCMPGVAHLRAFRIAIASTHASFHQAAFGTPKQGAGDGADLGEDVDAAPLVGDHAGHPAHLAFHLVQPGEAAGCVVGVAVWCGVRGICEAGDGSHLFSSLRGAPRAAGAR